ncbi:ermin [Arapaima gigas]
MNQEPQKVPGEEDMGSLVNGGPRGKGQENARKEETIDGAPLLQSLGDTHPSGERKKSVSLSNCPKYNSVSYRHIRKGNTKQRIDEFESMMHM